MRNKELAIILFLLSAMLLFYVVGRFREWNRAAQAVSQPYVAPATPQNYTNRLLPPQPPPDPADAAQQAQQQVIQAVQQLVSSQSAQTPIQAATLVSGQTISLPMPVYTSTGHWAGIKRTPGQFRMKTASTRKVAPQPKPTPTRTTTVPTPALPVARLPVFTGTPAASQSCSQVGAKCSSNKDCCNNRCSSGSCVKALRITRINFSSQYSGQTRR